MSSSHMWPVAVVLLLVVGCSTAPGASRPGPEAPWASSSGGQAGPGGVEVALTLDDPRIAESSGLARSRTHPGVLYTHNDAGTGPQVYAVDISGTRAVLTVEAEAIDWEDIASTPDGRLWIGDIGDREESRPTVSVHALAEPSKLSSANLSTVTYRFRYPDGPHNAEALLVDPEHLRVYLVTKAPVGAGIYATPRRPDPDEIVTLTRVGNAPPNVTGGDFAPGGGAFVLRNYRRAYFYPYLNAPPEVIELPEQEQGESIAYGDDYVLVGSEGERSQVLRVDAPGV